MLESLRKMSPSAKKKVVAAFASVLTLFILVFWVMHSFGVFSSSFESVKGQGVALFSFVEQNVQQAYDSFQANVPTITATTTDATSTDITEASTTQK